MEHPFKVGETYHNRSGRYEVLGIDGEKMQVRFEDGREVALTLNLQAQIWANIQVIEQTAVKRVDGKSKKPAAKKGPTKAEKQEKLVAQILETDETVFEILTRLVIPPEQCDLYSLFTRQPQKFFSPQQIADQAKEENPKGQRGLFMAFGRRIGASPDKRVKSLSPLNSLFLEHKTIGGKRCMRIRPRIVEIFKSYPQFYDYLINDGRWLAEEFGSPDLTINPDVYEKQMKYFGLWERINK